MNQKTKILNLLRERKESGATNIELNDRIQTYRAREIYLSTTEAKELSKILPKFLEEMEK